MTHRTPDDIRAFIVADLAAGLTAIEVARKYGVGRRSVFRIAKEADPALRAVKCDMRQPKDRASPVLATVVREAKEALHGDLAAAFAGVATKALKRLDEHLQPDAPIPRDQAAQVRFVLDRLLPSADARVAAVHGSEGLADLMRTVLATPAPPDDYAAQQAEIDRRNRELADPDAPPPA
ncbi:MAG: hypothetical protein ABII82_20205 [Verrucomicrobiota bacterium]